MQPKIYITDREAFHERMAIMLEDGSTHVTTVSSTATECGYQTVYGRVATAAANGDWQPAKDYCRREAHILGEEGAKDLMRQIQADIRDTMLIRAT